MPNLVMAAPKDGAELRDLIYSAVKYSSPVAVRYPRGATDGNSASEEFTFIKPGTAEVLLEGPDVTLLALGSMVSPAMEAARELEKSGIKAGVVNARFVKPLDEELIVRLAGTSGAIVTLEEGALAGGFGSAVLELFEQRGVNCSVKRIGVPDAFVEHGTQDELRAALGLDAGGIEETVKAFLVSADLRAGLAAN